MIYSRFCFKAIKAFPWTMGSVFFATGIERPRDEIGKKLNERIAKSHSVWSLLNLYEESKSNFAPFMVQASERLTTFLEADQDYNKEMLVDFCSSLKQLNPNELTQKEITTVLVFLRKLQMLRFSDLEKLRNSFLYTLQKIIRSKKHDKMKDIEQLAKYYEICTFFHDFAIQKTIYTKIYILIGKQISRKEEMTISIQGIQSFLKGSYYVEQVSLRQKLIRGRMLAVVERDLHKLQLEQIVEICFSLLRMDELDFQNKELATVNRVIEKLQKEIQNLSKSEMLRLLAIQDNRNNRSRLINLYKVITFKILDFITVEGRCEVPQQEVLDFLNFICQKLKLRNLQPGQNMKIFNFMKNVVKKAANSPSLSKPLILWILTHMLKHNYDFINQKHREDFQQIVNSIDFLVNVQFVYQLAIKDFDNSSVIKTVVMKQEMKIYKMFMKAIALKCCPLTNKDPNQKDILTKLMAKLEGLLITPHGFIKSIFKINSMDDPDELCQQIYRHFPDLLRKIQNPFQVQLKNYQYTIHFMQFVLRLLPIQFSKVSKMFPVSDSNITDSLLKDLIMRESRKDKYRLKPNKQLFYITLTKSQRIISSKNVPLLKAILILMLKCNRYLVYKDLDIYLEETVWKLLKTLTSNIPTFFELGLNKEVNVFLTSYLGKHFKHYTHSKEFMDFVVRVLGHLDLLKQSLSTLNNLFHAALRLNLLEAKHCQDKAMLQSLNLSSTQKQKIKIIVDQKYQCDFESLWRAQLPDLQSLVFNKNSLKVIEQNIEKIQAKIPKYSEYQLIQVLTSCNLPNKPITRRLVHKILRTILAKNKNMDSYDMGRVFNKSIEGHYFMIEEYSQLFYRYINFNLAFKGRSKFLDSLTLIHLAKFAATQPEKKELSLFYDLVQDWFTMNAPNTQLLVLSFLVDTSYPFTAKEIQMIPRVIQLYFRAGVKMFLYLQDRIPIQKRREIVKQIVHWLSIQAKDHKQKTIQDFFYRYIKKVYPEETKDLNLDQQKQRLIEIKFSSRPNLQIMEALNDVKSKLGLQIKLHREFGNNEVYELNDTFIVFISPTRTSSVYERKFVKKALKVLTNRNIPVFDLLNSVVKDQSIYLKLIKSKGLVLNSQQVQELIRKSQETATIQEDVGQQSRQKQGKFAQI